MKRTLSFESEDGDRFDKCELNQLLHATDAYLTLFDIDCYIRSYKKKDISEEVYEAMEAVHKYIYEAMENNGITLDDLP